MKKSSMLLGAALLLAVGVSSNANADITVKPSAISTAAFVTVRPTGWVVTSVKGTIKVTPPNPTNPAGFGCGDLSVTASSKEMVQPPDGFAYPKWSHYGKGQGDWASGSCTYSFSVPANSAFNLQLSWGNHNACDIVQGLTASPGTTGPFTLAKGGTKVQDYVLSGTPQCHWIP